MQDSGGSFLASLLAIKFEGRAPQPSEEEPAFVGPGPPLATRMRMRRRKTYAKRGAIVPRGNEEGAGLTILANGSGQAPLATRGQTAPKINLMPSAGEYRFRSRH